MKLDLLFKMTMSSEWQRKCSPKLYFYPVSFPLNCITGLDLHLFSADIVLLWYWCACNVVVTCGQLSHAYLLYKFVVLNSPGMFQFYQQHHNNSNLMICNRLGAVETMLVSTVGVEHRRVKHSGVQQNGVKHSGVKHSAVKHSAVKHHGDKHSAVKHHGVKHSAVCIWFRDLSMV